MSDALKEMRIERNGDQLVVHSENTQRFGGGLSVAIGVAALLLVSQIRSGSPDRLSVTAIGASVALGFVAFGLSLLLPRKVATVFDLGSREVRRTAVMSKWWKPTQTVPFADIMSIGFDQPDDSDRTYNAVIRLKTGKVVPIAASFTGEIDAETIDQIAATTGLKKRNVGDQSAA